MQNEPAGKFEAESAIQAHDPGWKDRYLEEACRLVRVLPGHVAYSLHHVGSTAVPGLAAKPIVDIALICDEHRHWPLFRHPIQSLGYVYWTEHPDAEHMFFVKGMPPFGPARTHHIHVRKSHHAQPLIQFRDRLRGDAVLRLRYETIKRDSFAAQPGDRFVYAQAKAEFIKRALADAPPA